MTLFAGCESDFDKCMEKRVPQFYTSDDFPMDMSEYESKINWAESEDFMKQTGTKASKEKKREEFIEHVKEDRAKKIASFGRDWEVKAINWASNICNYQGIYQ